MAAYSSARKPSQQRQSLRHSVVSAVPDGSVAKLYPTIDNYVNGDDGHRSPKSLAALCVDAVCRSLADLDGELPAGLPQNVVDEIIGSLVKHAALNATTLRVLRNCELGKLVLSACRGVTDEWLEPFAARNPTPSPGSARHESMDLDHSKKSHNERYGTFDHRGSQAHEEAFAECCDSSRSTSSFLSANSQLDPETEHTLSNSKEAASFAAMVTAAAGPPMEDVTMEDQYHDHDMYDCIPTAYVSSPTTNLMELDLRGSQRLTDKGLLQLRDLCQLEVARLDNCHAIVGRGLLAFSTSHRLHTLSLSGCRRLTDEAVVNISHMVTLESINLEGCRCLTDRSLEALSGLFGLRKLDLSQCDLITDDGLEYLESLHVIEELSLGWCRSITDTGLDVLTLQPGRPEVLKIIRLARILITDGGVEFLSRLLALEELDLNGCSKIGSVYLGRMLEKLPNLQTLDVSYCPGILRTSWQGKIPALRSIDLCYSGVNDGHLSKLLNLPNLEAINLDSCVMGDWAIAHLADNNVVPNLKSLDLADTELTDLGMIHLAKFQQLTRLSLFYCNISNGGLKHIAELTLLEELNLDSRDISDAGLFHLRKLQKLRCLDVFSGRITDSGCAHISRMESLESLELCGGGIGDLGCTLLAGCTLLTSLNLSQNERITNRGASALSVLTSLRALNLSNCSRVDASGNLRLPKSLQSLSMYGCRGIEDGNGMSLLQTDLPSLKCLRLNQESNEDGIMVGVANEEEDDPLDRDERNIASEREALRFARAAAFEADDAANDGDDSENSIMEEDDEVEPDIDDESI